MLQWQAKGPRKKRIRFNPNSLGLSYVIGDAKLFGDSITEETMPLAFRFTRSCWLFLQL